MSTRFGKSYSKAPLSARELRFRKQNAKRERLQLSAQLKPKRKKKVAKKASMSLAQVLSTPTAPEVAVMANPPAAPIEQALEPSEPNANPHLNVSKSKSKRKAKKKKRKPKIVKKFPFGIPLELVSSFDDFFKECCEIGGQKMKPSAEGLLTVGDVHKEYKQWCDKNNRPFCPERTSPAWNYAPFVVNDNRLEKLPPFRLLMFGKLSRLPSRSNAVFSTTDTLWRKHKKTSRGHPYYQGLAWRPSFTPTLRYLHKKKE